MTVLRVLAEVLRHIHGVYRRTEDHDYARCSKWYGAYHFRLWTTLVKKKSFIVIGCVDPSVVTSVSKASPDAIENTPENADANENAPKSEHIPCEASCGGAMVA